MSSVTSTEGTSFRPWHFFVVLTLLAATVAVLMSQKVAPEHLMLLSATIFAAGASALALYRTLIPLVGRERRFSNETLSHRARAALEREKVLVLRSIKDLEFDRAMGKLAQEDFDEMSERLRARAIGLMRQLDADVVAPRERLERELAERLRDDRPRDERRRAERAEVARSRVVSCQSCSAANDEDARFCKSCGTRLETSAPGAADTAVAPDQGLDS